MDELLHEYIEQLDNDDNNNNTKTGFDPEDPIHDSKQSDNDDNDDTCQQAEYEDYIARTKKYYYKMSCLDFFRAFWFSVSSLYICGSEYAKYKIGWKPRNNAIIDVSKRLAAKNMMYVKIFQAFATNRNVDFDICSGIDTEEQSN